VIINGRARGRSQQLAAHLLRRDQNEDIRLYELRGVTATDAAGALAEMEALTAAVHSKRPLYHASISPEAHTPLNDDKVRVAADTLERRLGLSGQPRVIVVHRKSGREHLHVVWSRLDLGRQRVISDAWSYAAHEEAARELEAAFGHRVVQGAFAPRPRRGYRDYEYRQAERSGKSPADVSAELTALWRGSSDAERFKKRLEEAGYILARGDRRVFVVIDRAGNAHSLGRRLGMPTRDLRVRLRGLDLDALPSVDDARAEVKRARQSPLRPQYREAAREATAAVRRRPGAPPKHAGRDRAFRAAAGWINVAAHAPQEAARVILSRFVTLARLRGIRAAILADFAAKMDDAARRLSDDELLAALKRLADERDAALRALQRLTDQPTMTVRRVRRLRRRRFSARRKASPPPK
jgi:Relaxase/Mobilisation nuclease domain